MPWQERRASPGLSCSPSIAAFHRRPFQPAWAPGAAAEELGTNEPGTRLAAEHRLALPRVRQGDAPAHPVGRTIDSSRSSTITPVRSGRTSLERDGKVVIEKTCPTHGTFTDTLAIDPAFLKRIESAVSRPRLQGRRAWPARSRHVVDSARTRRRVDDRSDQPLQHDVRSVLHGRQSGRLRPRADARRREAVARRCDHDQAAASDDGAVFGRRADDLADLPRLGPIRARRLATSACRRRPTASGSRRMPTFAREARDGGSAHRVPAVRRRQRRGQRTSQGRQSVRGQASRHRTSPRRRHRRVPRRHDRQRHQQRSGRPDHQVRARELRQDQLRLVSAGVVYRSRRRHQRRATGTRAATRCRIWRTTSKRRPARPSRCATGFRSRRRASSRMSPTCCRGPEPIGERSNAGAIPIAASARRSWSARKRRSGRRSRASSTSSGSSPTRASSPTPRRGPFLTKLQTGAEPAAQLFTGPGAGGLHARETAAEVGQAERRTIRRRTQRRDRRRIGRATSG